MYVGLKQPRGDGERYVTPARAATKETNLTVSKNGEVYMFETSCMKGTSGDINNMWIEQLCNRKVWDFAMVLRDQNVLGVFEKRAPVPFTERV